MENIITRQEAERIVRAPLITKKDLIKITSPLRFTYYQVSKLFTAMKKQYETEAMSQNYMLFNSIPNKIAFDYLAMIGITKESLLDESYWRM